MPSKPAVFAERFKTSLCRAFTETGECQYGPRCMFAHGEHELRTKEMNMADGIFRLQNIHAFRRMAAAAAKREAQVLAAATTVAAAAAEVANRSPASRGTATTGTTSSAEDALNDESPSGSATTPPQSRAAVTRTRGDFASARPRRFTHDPYHAAPVDGVVGGPHSMTPLRGVPASLPMPAFDPRHADGYDAAVPSPDVSVAASSGVSFVPTPSRRGGSGSAHLPLAHALAVRTSATA